MVIPVDFAQINFKFTGAGVPRGAECTLGCSVALYAGGPDDLALDAFNAYVASGLRSHVATTVVLSEVLVKFGPNSTGPSGIVTLTSAGLAAGDTLPNTAFLFTRITGTGGRHGRGRMYLPGAVESEIANGGTISAAVAGAMTTSMATLLGDLSSVQAIPVLLHSDATTPYIITSMPCQTTLATQRRRLRG